MRILVITGKLAKEEVLKAVKGFNVDVFVADVDVAAFITPAHVEKAPLSSYDLVLLPGNAKGNWKELEERVGVKIRLGSVHTADLPKILKNLDKIELSHTTPACKLLSSVIAEEVVEMVNRDREGVANPVRVGSVVIGEGRMKVVAEIVDATELSRDELSSKIEYYLESGADVIDVGVPLSADAEKAEKAVKLALDCCDAVSVDTFSYEIIRRAVKAGVHMVMSVSKDNLKALDLIEEQAVVIVSRDVSELKKLVDYAKKRGKNVIADCILDFPLRLYSSLSRYAEFRVVDRETPVLMGAGNVTELCDADSTGINALLAFIAEEIGVNALFTTEASYKTKGSVKELKVASYMARAAKLRKTPPKDLGLNLLALKEKVVVREDLKEEISKEISIVNAKPSGFVRDPKGDFRIFILDEEIVALHESGIAVKGSAENVCKEVIKLGLISRLDHAAYIGRELKKAEIAAKLGKSYVQDEELNFGIYSKALDFIKNVS